MFLLLSVTLSCCRPPLIVQTFPSQTSGLFPGPTPTNEPAVTIHVVQSFSEYGFFILFGKYLETELLGHLVHVCLPF